MAVGTHSLQVGDKNELSFLVTTRSNQRKWTSLFALVILFNLVGCIQRNAKHGEKKSESPELILPVRVHVLTSDSDEYLDCAFTDDQLRRHFDAVNAIWKQARISWRIESIIHEPAENEREFRRLLEIAQSRGLFDVLPFMNVLETIFPTDNLLTPGWNVVFADNLGRISRGNYQPKTGVVLCGRTSPTGFNPPSILAHELGHSLGLIHTESHRTDNLMMTSSPKRQITELTRLNVLQIAFARSVAKTGIAWPYYPIGSDKHIARFFALNDENGDGVISQDEAPVSIREQFAVGDKNGDGGLDVNEFTVRFWNYTAPHEGLMREFTSNDANGDGSVSRNESTNHFWRTCEFFDGDKDDMLTFEEFITGLKELASSSETILEYVARLFRLNDHDGDAMISRNEGTPRFKRYFEFYDTDNSGTITLSEFETAWKRRHPPYAQPPQSVKRNY